MDPHHDYLGPRVAYIWTRYGVCANGVDESWRPGRTCLVVGTVVRCGGTAAGRERVCGGEVGSQGWAPTQARSGRVAGWCST